MIRWFGQYSPDWIFTFRGRWLCSEFPHQLSAVSCTLLTQNLSLSLSYSFSHSILSESYPNLFRWCLTRASLSLVRVCVLSAKRMQMSAWLPVLFWSGRYTLIGELICERGLCGFLLSMPRWSSPWQTSEQHAHTHTVTLTMLTVAHYATKTTVAETLYQSR